MKAAIALTNLLRKYYTETPDSINPQVVRTYNLVKFSAPLGLLSHLALSGLFFHIGAYLLVYFNIFSLAIWIIVIPLNRRGYLYTCLILMFAEIFLHVLLSVFVLGAESGFQLFFLLLAMSLYLAPMGHTVLKIGLSIICLVAFIVSSLVGQLESIAFFMDPSYNLVFFLMNSISSGYFLITNGLYFSHATYKAERELAQEHEKVESLLHNILPVKIAQRLKDERITIADHFPDATVLFSDIVGFTNLSARISPQELVNLLNEIFTRFDDLLEKYGLEKIKTIGDAYMAAAGIPEAQSDHHTRICNFALDMLKIVKEFHSTHGNTLQIRIGINSGPVVAGVIGKKKFIYDLWGDTVNTAARMESHGIPGEIQISENTFHLVKDAFITESRGSIAIKGKGDLNTWLLKERK